MSGGWNTIESDAVRGFFQGHTSHADCEKGVFSHLVAQLGVKDVQFEELVALDANYLAAQRFVISIDCRVA